MEDLEEQADLVFVDAPCSGSGTWRRHPDGAWRLQPETVERLAALQAAILARAARLVKPGGRLAYATCSVLPPENAAVAEGFAATHGAFGALPISQAAESAPTHRCRPDAAWRTGRRRAHAAAHAPPQRDRRLLRSPCSNGSHEPTRPFIRPIVRGDRAPAGPDRRLRQPGHPADRPPGARGRGLLRGPPLPEGERRLPGRLFPPGGDPLRRPGKRGRRRQPAGARPACSPAACPCWASATAR